MTSDRAAAVLARATVVDGLCHTLLGDPPPHDRPMDIVDMLLAGGVHAVNATVLIDDYKNDFLTCIRALHQHFILEEAIPDKVLIVRRPSDIALAKEEGKLGVVLSIQGADSIEHDIRYITMLQRLGIRLIQITYNQRNHLGDGAYEPFDAGLTRFGQQVILEMNRLGIVVDLSHAGHRTSLEAIDLSSDPVVFSHSSVRALCPHPRNLTNEQIRALAAKGGVVGICPHSVMCAKARGEWPTVDDYVDHIRYVVDLAGEDCVGVGTDRWMRTTLGYKMQRVEFERTMPGFFGGYTGEQKHVQGFNYYDQWSNLIEHLQRRGFGDEQVMKVLGGNLLRVFRAVWHDE